VLCGCAPTGNTANQIHGERSFNRLKDWNASAARVAWSMEQAGVIPAMAAPGVARLFPGPYYVHVMTQGSTFLDAVRQAMLHELLRRGAEIARSPERATVINLDIDVVRYAAGPVFPTPAEAEWRATIVTGNRVMMRTGETFSIAANDLPLYLGSTTLAAIASPGDSLLGAARPLRYAR
jgi:hypothetical protein